MSTSNANHALAAFVRLLLHARAGGQAKVDALLALSQRTLHVPRKVDGGEGFATLLNENGDWALPVFTSQEQLEAAADVFGWRRQDRTISAEEVGARRAVHYALNEGAAFMVIDAVAPHALEATREELKPLVSTQNRSDTFGPYAGVGRISSSILEATRPDAERASVPPIAAPRITRQPVEPSVSPSKLPARVTRASFAPPRDDGAPAQRRPTVSFARSSRPPAAVEVQLGRSSWSPDAPVDLPSPPPVAGAPRQTPRPQEGSSAVDMRLADMRTAASLLPDLDLEDPPSQVSLRPMSELPSLDHAPPRTDRPRMSSRPVGALLDLDDPLDLGEPMGPDTELPPAFPATHAPYGSSASAAPYGSSASAAPSALPAAPLGSAALPAAPPVPHDLAPPAEEPIEIRALLKPPDDALLAALTEMLRDYPEVEWATISLAARGDASAKPAIGLRIIDNFRSNVDAIVTLTQVTGRDHGLTLHVLLLDDPDLVRSARTLGEVFYPWRRKTRSSVP